MSRLFDECIAMIEAKYAELGHVLGWRFLSVSKEVLSSRPEVALITLNPGGNEIPADHPWGSCEQGCSYIVEKWGSSLPGQHPLQIQVRALFQAIADSSKSLPKDGKALLEGSLIAHFVPFRSPRLETLVAKDHSLIFGVELWRRILSEVHPRLIVCISRDAYPELKSILGEVVGPLETWQEIPTGWGDYKADLVVFRGPRAVRLLRLPHLSTFKLFSSLRCRPSMVAILDEACRDL